LSVFSAFYKFSRVKAVNQRSPFPHQPIQRL
jgi:hypothetical protein